MRFQRVDIGTAAASAEALLVLRGASGNDDRIEILLKPGEPVRAQVLPGSSWVGEVSTPALWTSSFQVTAGAAGSISDQRVFLWPASRAEGVLRRPDGGDNLPRTLSLEVASPPSPERKQEIAKTNVPCEVAEQGRFSCPVPAAFLDLVLKANEYAPNYFWGQWPEASTPLNLGTVLVRPGGSIAGWVVSEGEGGVLLGAVAKVSPLLAAGKASDIETERLRRIAFEGKVSERGFFQLPSLAAGEYQLEVSKAGLAPAKAFPLKVWPGAETFLSEPLVLRPPLAVAVAVQPPKDWMGQPWQVTVRRHSDWSGGFEHPEVFVGRADLDGRVLVPGQAPGRYWVTVADSKGNRLYSAGEQAVLGPDDAEIPVQLPLVVVDGEVTYRDEPVAAELRFGGTFGAVAVEMNAGDDGLFAGVLPREGAWRVDILLLERELRTHAKVGVEVGSDGIAIVKVEVPDTRVFGTVTDPEGLPVGNAQVLLETSAAPQHASTDAKGEFEFLGVPEGTIVLSAQARLAAGPAASESSSFELSEEVPAGPVMLRVERSVEHRGTVESPLGVVAGASLSAWCLVPPSPALESARSSVDGSFRVRAPGGCQRLAVAVSPPGHALTFFELVPSEGSLGSLRVGSEAGDLEVVLPWEPQPSEEPSYTPVYFRGGLGLPLSILSRWAAGNGKPLLGGNTLRVPRLEPGPYRVCLAVPSLEPREEGAQPFAENLCREGFLPAGGVLRLELKKAEP